MRKIKCLLAALVAVPLAACSPTTAAQAPSTTTSVPALRGAEYKDLETRFDARLGIYATNVATGRSVSSRQDERFGIRSVFKPYAAAALLKAHPLRSGFFNQRIHFTQAEIVDSSPVTSTHVADGMTVAELCDAAITRSDNTAGNQLLKLLGGPAKL